MIQCDRTAPCVEQSRAPLVNHSWDE